MSTNELLNHYASVIPIDSQILELDNPVLREYVSELRATLENRAILRILRFEAGIPICCGDGHCVTQPSVRCMKGEHQTCQEHVESCYLCR
jgi:hypothetical protein